MKFTTQAAARYFWKTGYGPNYRETHRVVKSRHWSCDRWEWVSCWAVVMK